MTFDLNKSFLSPSKPFKTVSSFFVFLYMFEILVNIALIHQTLSNAPQNDFYSQEKSEVGTHEQHGRNTVVMGSFVLKSSGHLNMNALPLFLSLLPMAKNLYLCGAKCVFNRPGVAGAVLQSPPLLIH